MNDMSTPQPRQITIVSAADFDGKPVPERLFHVPDLIPDRTVTNLAGDGGTGKSLLALQLGVATVAGRQWCNRQVAEGPVIYVSAEDDLDEVHRRLFAIANGNGIGLDRLDDLHIVPLAGEDAVLAAPDKASLKPTTLFAAVEAEIALRKPALVVLDTSADLFGGVENDRAQVRQFIGMLRGLAIRHQCAVLLLSHPSLTGMSSGTGTSGSTAWSNSVRSRLYLDRVKDDGGAELDPNLRVLKVMKANYRAIGGEIRLRWQDGLFEALDEPQASAFGAIAARDRARHVFMRVVETMNAEGRYLSPHPTSHSYAPTIIARHPEAQGITKSAFDAAMQRLFSDGQIRVGKSPGAPSKQTDIVEVVHP